MNIDPWKFQAKLDDLWPVDEGHPCSECTALLFQFATVRPQDFEFLTAGDMVDPNQLGFAGIPEWDRFLERFSSCEICTA